MTTGQEASLKKPLTLGEIADHLGVPEGDNRVDAFRQCLLRGIVGERTFELNGGLFLYEGVLNDLYAAIHKTNIGG